MTNTKPVILMIGMPGAGKTTSGGMLAERLLLPFRSMGDVLRAGRRDGMTHNTIDIATGLLERHLLQTPTVFANGFVLDFSPVRAEAYQWLCTMLLGQAFEIACTVYVRTKTKTALQRFLLRGPRSNDPKEDMSAFFKRRLSQEF